MDTPSATVEPTVAEATPAARVLHELGERIDALDRSGAVGVALGAVADGSVSIPDLYLHVLTPYLAAIGAQWRHGSERVWHEHFATHTVRTIIESLYPAVALIAGEMPAKGDTVLLACPPNEEHELGLRMLSDRFELAGYRTIFLGANTPADEIAAAAIATDANVIVMSVATLVERVDMRRVIDTIQEKVPQALVRVTGPAIAADTSSQFSAEFLDPAEFDLPGTALAD